MSVPAIKKFMNYLWGENEESEAQDYNEEYNQVDYEDYDEEPESTGETLGIFKRKAKVVPMQQHQIKMKIAKPTNYEQTDEIVQQLKMKNAVVMNLEYVSKDVARRIVDTVSGAVQALDGNMEKVSNSIFVVAPYNYDIVSEITKEKIETRMASNWIK